MSISHFGVYLAVGTVVGLITVAARELWAVLLPSDSAICYSISVVGAYALGVLLSFLLQRRITFSTRQVRFRLKVFAGFVSVALVGALATWLLSMAFRYVLQFDVLFGRYGATTAFVLAAVCASAATYSLNATWVFRGHRSESV